VTVDGAAHLGSAAILRDVIEGVGAIHLRYLDFASFPAPNILPAIGLALVTLVVDPPTAEKILQIAYVAAMPLALLYAVRSVRRGRDWLALLAFPMTFTFAFQYGFYDFSFGVALFLVVAGFLWRHREAPRWGHAVTFGGLALVLYLTHLVPFLHLLVFAAVIGAWRVLGAWRGGGTRAAIAAVRPLLPLALAALPSAALAVAFLVQTGSAVPGQYLALPLQVIGVLGLALGLVTTDPLEIAVAVALAASLLLLFVLAAAARLRAGARTLRPEDALLAYAVASVVIACLAPGSVASGGSYIPERLALFPVYGLALWLAAAEPPRWSIRSGVAVWLAASVAFVLLRLPTTQRLSDAAVDVESVGACVATEATMIQVNLSRLPAGTLARTDPFSDEAGRVAAATRGHDLGSFEGTFPFFVFRNRPDNDPYRWLVTNPSGFLVPPAVDLDAYRGRPYGTVDYVIVVGRPTATAETLASPGWAILRDQLSREYRRVGASADGLAEGWERLDPALSDAGAARRAAAHTSSCVAT
jgi:hypothetical protein